MSKLFKEVKLREGALVQFVGCHVVKWPYDVMQPTIGFTEVAQGRHVFLESACTSVEFDGDPTGAVKALVKALEPFADEPILDELDDDLLKDTQIKVGFFRAARAAHARVRLRNQPIPSAFPASQVFALAGASNGAGDGIAREGKDKADKENAMRDYQRKCVICGQKHDPVYLWQPWGPADDANLFPFCGWQYRGYRSFHVCESCKAKVEQGQTLNFSYKDKRLVFDGRVLKVEAVQA